MEFYPDGTRLFIKSETTNFYVIEQKPTVRTLTFDTKYLQPVLVNEKCHFKTMGYTYTNPLIKHQVKRVKYRLPLPYCVFLINKDFKGINSYVALYFKNKPLNKINTDLFRSANILPNIYSDGRVCLDVIGVNDYQKILNAFWNSVFTCYLSNKVIIKGLETFEEWQKLSLKDVLKKNWSPTGKLNQIINRLGG